MTDNEEIMQPINLQDKVGSTDQSTAALQQKRDGILIISDETVRERLEKTK